ncbi:LysR substrate-binding domain-containing protein, partial [Aeromonas australiensis]|uniref:LysR substrate-binding domain-containing protein n=1 Tax=Aeromonas australiensis TaxID=1114880 RepID=UPI001F3AF071
LMTRAGAALCSYAAQHWPESRSWWIFVGPGNNGGGGFMLGRPARPIGIEGEGVGARAPPQPAGGGGGAAALPAPPGGPQKGGRPGFLPGPPPAYRARRGPPRPPADLATHDWLCGEMLGNGVLLLDEKGGEHRVRFKAKVLCNNVLPLRQFALAGQGISLQPEGEIGEDLAQGRLLELLPGFRVAPMEIHAITPQREIPEKVRRVVEALRAYFGAA